MKILEKCTIMRKNVRPQKYKCTIDLNRFGGLEKGILARTTIAD